MKYLLLIGVVAMLSGCIEQACHLRPDQEVRQRIFKECMTVTAEARKGRDYHATMGENFYKAIKACENSAYYQSLTRAHCEGK